MIEKVKFPKTTNLAGRIPPLYFQEVQVLRTPLFQQMISSSVMLYSRSELLLFLHSLLLKFYKYQSQLVEHDDLHGSEYFLVLDLDERFVWNACVLKLIPPLPPNVEPKVLEAFYVYESCQKEFHPLQA